MMTTAAMVFGMLPIATSLDAGSEWKSGLAWAIIGGLISSMFLTLILVPVIYMKVETWRVTVPAFLKKVFLGKKKQHQEELGLEGK
jgi:HAE1 family hydrophobic/amphiphilic exporter-1